MRISDWSSDVCSSDRGRPSTSSATAAGPSLFPPPGEHRRDGVVPDDTHHRPREAAQPPAVVQIIDHLADADVADRTHKADRIEGEQALDEGRALDRKSTRLNSSH